jgi:hypothetical protein
VLTVWARGSALKRDNVREGRCGSAIGHGSRRCGGGHRGSWESAFGLAGLKTTLLVPWRLITSRGGNSKEKEREENIDYEASKK